MVFTTVIHGFNHIPAEINCLFLLFVQLISVSNNINDVFAFRFGFYRFLHCIFSCCRSINLTLQSLMRISVW